jgi:hypothetical protein
MRKNFTELYEPLVQAARARLQTDPGLHALLDPDVHPELLEAFLIHFSSLGMKMTEPVDGWIRRAGERCNEIGLKDVGRALIAHASHEAGHHLMMLEDARYLVTRWNERLSPKLDVDALVSRPPTPAMRRYAQIHETTIASDTPYAQLAIEERIEEMSVVLGPKLVKQCLHVLGPQVTEGISFMTHHVELDVGHTHFNQNQIEKLLALHPEMAGPLARAGSAALMAYVDFLNECLVMAKDTLAAADRQPKPAAAVAPEAPRSA